MVDVFLDYSRAAIARSRIAPRWHQKPLLIVKSNIGLDQYPLYDLGVGRAQATRVVGTSFGIHREKLGQECYFDESLGSREGKLVGGEESDLCRRVGELRLDVSTRGEFQSSTKSSLNAFHTVGS